MLRDQTGFAYSDEELQELLHFISQERLQAYYGLVRKFTSPHDRLQKAVGLYEKNTQYSESLYPVLQAFEITIRNAVHRRLAKDLGSANWFTQVPLDSYSKESIAKAERDLSGKGQPLTPDYVVGELSFSFWVHLFSSEYESLLWERSLKHMLPPRLTRGMVYTRFKEIKTLRNRVAHHSRIIDRPTKVRDAYAQTMQAIGWLSATVEEWVEATSRADLVLPKPIFKRSA